MVAAQKGHHECISILLAHGADVKMAEKVKLFVALESVRLILTCLLNVMYSVVELHFMLLFSLERWRRLYG